MKALLAGVAGGELSAEDAAAQLRRLPFVDTGDAKVDHHRTLRLGMPEVVLAERKTAAQIVEICRELIDAAGRVLVTRVQPEKAVEVLSSLPQLRHNDVARTLSYQAQEPEPLCDVPVNVITAGTSDLPVAQEAIETLNVCGVPSRLISDAGVAGIHRLLRYQDDLATAPANIVIAGMEGALASVVGGLIPGPIVAVPTSVGYGAAMGGMTALFGMLTSCASGVTVVNIDNGFGAAMAVVRAVRPTAGAKR